MNPGGSVPGPVPDCVRRLLEQQRALGISDELMDKLVATPDSVLMPAAFQALLQGRPEYRDFLCTLMESKAAARAHRAATS